MKCCIPKCKKQAVHNYNMHGGIMFAYCDSHNYIPKKMLKNTMKFKVKREQNGNR